MKLKRLVPDQISQSTLVLHFELRRPAVNDIGQGYVFDANFHIFTLSSKRGYLQKSKFWTESESGNRLDGEGQHAYSNLSPD
jgi:hypothetical protein